MIVFGAKVKPMPPVTDQPEISTSTACWLWNSTHSSPGSFVAGWYMISLNTTTVSASADWRIRRVENKSRRVGYRIILRVQHGGAAQRLTAVEPFAAGNSIPG